MGKKQKKMHLAAGGDVGELLGRELSARVVMFHSAVASRLGLNATDLKTLDLLCRNGPATAGKLAAITGLTTGAVTGIVDRLEKAGFVRRIRSEEDRRQVTIETIPRQGENYADLFGPLHRSMGKLRGRYSPEELSVVERFVHETIEILKEETARLRGDA